MMQIAKAARSLSRRQGARNPPERTVSITETLSEFT